MAGIVARIFQCRMPDFDGETEWTDVEAFNAEDAAEEYAGQCDNHSAMECFEGGAEPIIIVKADDGVERQFKCSRDFDPVYFADEVDPKPEPACDIPI